MGVHQQPVFSAKSRSRTYRRKSGDGAAKRLPFGLAPDALLAKIDALQADLPTTVFTPDEPEPVPAPKSRFPVWAAALAGMAAAVLAMLAWQFLAAEPPPPPLPVVVAEPAPAPAEEPPPPAEPAVAEAVPAVAAAAGTVKLIDDTARRRAAAAEKKRKAEEARLAQEEEERRLRAEQAARLQAEREEAERRARAAVPVAPPVPKGPSSPQELCAGETGLFARSNCEARACSESQWRTHAYCVKRWDEQMKRLNSGY